MQGWFIIQCLFFPFLSSYKKALNSCQFFHLSFQSYYASICINMTADHSAKAPTEMIQAKKQQDKNVTKFDNSHPSSVPWSTLLSSFISTSKDAATSSESICTTAAELKLAAPFLIANRTNTPARATLQSLLKTAARKPQELEQVRQT